MRLGICRFGKEASKKMPALPPENAGTVQRLFQAASPLLSPSTSLAQDAVWEKLPPRNKSRHLISTTQTNFADVYFQQLLYAAVEKNPKI